MSIRFHNGHVFDYGCASGAMAFHGDGWWFEQPARWLGLLRPEEFTIIIKTLTFFPCKGNYRWWCPWRCVQVMGNDVVNAVALTNNGYQWWMDEPYRYICKRGYKVIVSIMPNDLNEARLMAHDLNSLKEIVGLQLNVSCPNVSRDQSINYICDMTDVVSKITKHPLILKLSYLDDYVAICKEMDGKLTAFELINSVLFTKVFPDRRSPLAKYGFIGGASGNCIIPFAREALVDVKNARVRTAVISGGGIGSEEEVNVREGMGAEGCVFGSVFIPRFPFILRNPSLPNRIIANCRKRKENGCVVAT